MKKLFLFALMLILASGLLSLAAFDVERHVPNSIIVCFDAQSINTTRGKIDVITNTRGQIEIGLNSFDSIASNFNFTNIERLFFVIDSEWKDSNGAYPMNIFNVTIADNNEIEQAINALNLCTDVIFAEFQGKVELDFTPNDPRFINQWHHINIQSSYMWDVAQDASEIIIAIVDTGAKWNHEDLWQNIYLDPLELPGVTINWDTGEIVSDGVDYDENGYPNDVMGWDFSNWAGTPNPGNNNPFEDRTGSVWTHGTHVAGIAGAIGNNGIGITGVAMNVKLMNIKIKPETQENKTLKKLQGILYAAEKGAHVINCSWSSPKGISNTEIYLHEVVVNFATYQGSLVVASAGNTGNETNYAGNEPVDNVNYPAGATNAVAVGSTNSNDHRAGDSVYGSWLDLMAPGYNVLSTLYTTSGDDYVIMSGTSMAAPVVAGIAAMIKATHPTFTPLQIKQRLIETTDPLPQDIPGNSLYGMMGSGRVNALNAVIDGKTSHQLSQGSIHWVSFPYLPIMSHDLETVLNNSFGNTLLSISPDSNIKQISWNYGDPASLYWSTIEQDWVNKNHVLDSRYGYKIQMPSSEDKIITVAGYQPDYWGNDSDLMVLPRSHTTTEIWLGYFMPQNEHPLYALQEIEPYLSMIKTQYWSLSKVYKQNGDYFWAGLSNSEYRLSFEQGIVVILQYISLESLHFRWQVREEILDRYEHPIAQHFDYEEQLDYIPIYITMSDNMKNYNNAELGLFINDVCYGAAVVYDDDIQILAYILEQEIDDNALIEFRYHEYGSRSSARVLSDYQVFDNQKKVYQTEKLNLSKKEKFYMISFLDEIEQPDENTPIKTALFSNYPNPFNPSTTISYNLAESGNVKLDIYNIRGQLIKTLVNEQKEPGNYSIIWQGDDKNGITVTSGFYFYRLETNTTKLVKKMLLIK